MQIYRRSDLILPRYFQYRRGDKHLSVCGFVGRFENAHRHKFFHAALGSVIGYPQQPLGLSDGDQRRFKETVRKAEEQSGRPGLCPNPASSPSARSARERVPISPASNVSDGGKGSGTKAQ